MRVEQKVLTAKYKDGDVVVVGPEWVVVYIQYKTLYAKCVAGSIYWVWHEASPSSYTGGYPIEEMDTSLNRYRYSEGSKYVTQYI